jgi:Flp pilus assembly protein TadD
MKLHKVSMLTVAITLPLLANQSQRKALVVGNDDYLHGHSLKNAQNDARSISDAFVQLGYSVTTALDVSRDQLDQAVALFAQTLVRGDTAIFYYSGHGFQADGDNYLVPTDFDAETTSEGKLKGYSVSTVLHAMAAHGATTQLIILDACRDNPFITSKSFRAGWAAVGTAAGTLIAFGTAPGAVASDNPLAHNGLFTQKLLSHMDAQLPIEDMLKLVRADTIAASVGEQVPWLASSLTGSFYLDAKLETSPPAADEVSVADRVALQDNNSRSIVRRSDPQPTVEGSGGDLGASRSADILVSQGLQLAGQGNYAEATRSLSAALAIRPGLAVALRVIGLIFYALGRTADALAQFSRALSANPRDNLAYSYRCSLLTKTDSDSAIRDCEASIGIDPTYIPAHLGLANALIAAGQREEALKEINQTISLFPTLSRAYALRGRIEAQLGQSETAGRDIRTAISLSLEEPH